MCESILKVPGGVFTCENFLLFTVPSTPNSSPDIWAFESQRFSLFPTPSSIPATDRSIFDKYIATSPK
jgi:hypothetical protein